MPETIVIGPQLQHRIGLVENKLLDSFSYQLPQNYSYFWHYEIKFSKKTFVFENPFLGMKFKKSVEA